MAAPSAIVIKCFILGSPVVSRIGAFRNLCARSHIFRTKSVGGSVASMVTAEVHCFGVKGRRAAHALRLWLLLGEDRVVVVSGDEAFLDVVDLIEPGLRGGEALAIGADHILLERIKPVSSIIDLFTEDVPLC